MTSSARAAPPGGGAHLAGARLAIFDVDGTLTDTNAVDDACYFASAGEVYGPAAAAVDWSGAPLERVDLVAPSAEVVRRERALLDQVHEELLRRAVKSLSTSRASAERRAAARATRGT